jgi:Spy/CpxP family protein refolding chaperone
MRAFPERLSPTCLGLLLSMAALTGPLEAQHGHDPAHHHSPYAGLEAREIKALDPGEVEALLAGEGMGFALAAELNGIPGPLHVLELAGPLELSSEQEAAVREIFQAMREETSRMGAEVVELERTLDRRFQHRHIDAAVIRDLTQRIALLRGEIRAIHLEAHLAVDPLLTEPQREAYLRLRGYSGADLTPPR